MSNWSDWAPSVYAALFILLSSLSETERKKRDTASRVFAFLFTVGAVVTLAQGFRLS